MENEIQEVDLLNDTEEVIENESIETQDVDIDKLKETNSKLYARAKQAEQERKELLAKLKALESKDVPQQINNTQSSLTQEDLDLAILRSVKGYDENTIDQLRVISKGKGISLIQAQEDPLFKLALERSEEEKRKAKATLGASRGASGTKRAKSISEMSREEHMAYVKERMGN